LDLAGVNDTEGALVMTTRRLVRSMAVVAGIALLAAACSDSKKITSGDSSTTVPEASSTTSADAGSTTTATSTTVAATTPATPAPTTPPTAPPTAPPTTAAPGPTGTPLGAPTNLQATPTGGITLDATFDCSFDPGIPGWTVDDCQQMPSYNDGVTTLVLHRNDDGRLALAVLFKSGASLVQKYWAAEDGPGVWSAITVLLGDFHFDDGAEVWVGYRYQGTGQYLDVDVLDPLPGGVYFLGGLREISHGVVDVHPGGATVQTALYGASDPNCCPSSFLQQEITFASNQWVIDAGTTYPAAGAPPITGDF
jgi:hypothetical protein